MYQTILNVLDEETQSKNDSKEKEPVRKKQKYKVSSTQDDIPLKNIRDGIMLTDDNRYVSFVEVLPIPFNKKSPNIRNNILSYFGQLFVNGPYKLDFKIMCDYPDASSLIENIKKTCKTQNDPIVKKALENYLNFVKEKSESGTTSVRYFVIYEYEPKQGTSDNPSFAEIKSGMNQFRTNLINVLSQCGNICIDYDDKDYEVLSFLYRFFNRKTSRVESLQSRYERMSHDFAKFRELTGKEKNVTFADLIAPKGTEYRNRDYVVVDGTYYGFLGVKGDSFPSLVEGGWLDNFLFGHPVDIDILCKKLPQEATKLSLGQLKNLTRKTARSKRDAEKASELFSKGKDIAYMHQMMDAGENMYYTSIILTVRANSPGQLKEFMNTVTDSLTRKGLQMDDSFLCAEEYFIMTMPFLYITQPNGRLRHNMLTSQMQSLYPFTQPQQFDPTGIVLGEDELNGLVCINPYNNKIFKNPNTVIAGGSGAGKSYLQGLISTRLRYSNVRSFFLIPQKGYTYKSITTMMNGTYLPFFPGSPLNYNPMEIIPENDFDEDAVDTATREEIDALRKVSYLAKKISFLQTWLTLLPGNESLNQSQLSRIDKYLTQLYGSFGITNDNDSIYKDKANGILKPFPFIEHMQKAFMVDSDLKTVVDSLEAFVSGSYSNFNKPTNVDLSNMCIVFDIDVDIIGEKMLPAMMYMGFDHIYGTVKNSTSCKSAVILDEVWQMLKSPESASQIDKIMRLIRGYGGATFICTQKLEDFMATPFGRSVMANANIKIILGMEQEEVDSIKDIVKLSEEQCNKIVRFKPGDGILIARGDSTNLHFTASEYEDYYFKDRTSKKVS